MNIDHILEREDASPQNRYKKSDRFQIIAECVRSEDRRARKLLKPSRLRAEIG